MDKGELEKRLDRLEQERKWLKRAIKVIEDGEKFQTKETPDRKSIQATTAGTGASARVRP